MFIFGGSPSKFPWKLQRVPWELRRVPLKPLKLLCSPCKCWSGRMLFIAFTCLRGRARSFHGSVRGIPCNIVFFWWKSRHYCVFLVRSRGISNGIPRAPVGVLWDATGPMAASHGIPQDLHYVVYVLGSQGVPIDVVGFYGNSRSPGVP